MPISWLDFFRPNKSHRSGKSPNQDSNQILVIKNGDVELFFNPPSQSELEEYLYGDIQERYFWAKHLVGWRGLMDMQGNSLPINEYTQGQVMQNSAIRPHVEEVFNKLSPDSELCWIIDCLNPSLMLKNLFSKRELVYDRDLHEIPGQPNQQTWKGFITKVAGVKYETRGGRERQYNFYGLRDGDPVRLVREPGNGYDPNAVMVLRFKRQFDLEDQIGYLRDHVASDVAAWAERGFHIYAEVKSQPHNYYEMSDEEEELERSYFDCLLSLDIYVPRDAPFSLRLESDFGFSPSLIKSLVNAGISNMDELSRTTKDQLMSIKGIGPKTAFHILETIKLKE